MDILPPLLPGPSPTQMRRTRVWTCPAPYSHPHPGLVGVSTGSSNSNTNSNTALPPPGGPGASPYAKARLPPPLSPSRTLVLPLIPFRRHHRIDHTNIPVDLSHTTAQHPHPLCLCRVIQLEVVVGGTTRIGAGSRGNDKGKQTESAGEDGNRKRTWVVGGSGGVEGEPEWKGRPAKILNQPLDLSQQEPKQVQMQFSHYNHHGPDGEVVENVF